jgi:hypothetical protein
MGLFKHHSTPKLLSPLSIIVLGIFSVLLLTFAVSAETHAVTKLKNMSPEDSAKAFVYYKALRTCLADGYYRNNSGTASNIASMSPENANKFEWFYDGGLIQPKTNVGVYGDNRDSGELTEGLHTCAGDTQGERFIGEFLALTGYTNGPEFLCKIGFTRQNNTLGCTTTNPGDTNDFLAPADAGGKLDTWWTNTMGATNLGPSGIGILKHLSKDARQG